MNNIGSITFSGITQIENEIIYNGIKCLYVDRGLDYWVQPLSQFDSINGFAGMGKSITKEEFNNLYNQIKTPNTQ
jgi:hypothetical protein